MLISEEYGFLFIHVPKTAGTSVSAVLEPLAQYRRPSLAIKLCRRLPGRLPPRSRYFSQHARAADVRRRIGADHFDRLFSFAFVRNPYAHALSHYRHLSRYRHQRIARRVRQMDFASFLRWRSAGAQRMHWHYVERVVFMGDQAGFVTDTAGRVLVDRICRFERLEAEISSLSSHLRLPPVSMPHLLASGAPQGKADSAVFTPEAIALINRLYTRDFDLFGYRKVEQAQDLCDDLSHASLPDGLMDG